MHKRPDKEYRPLYSSMSKSEANHPKVSVGERTVSIDSRRGDYDKPHDRDMSRPKVQL